MSRLAGIAFVLLVLLLAMGFAAVNAGHTVTIDIGFLTLYRVPVTLVAFAGLFLGMLVMFVTGIHSDLRVRRILRDRLSEESRQEQRWIDRSQQDLFADTPSSGPGEPPPESEEPGAEVREPGRPEARESGRPEAWEPGRPEAREPGRPEAREPTLEPGEPRFEAREEEPGAAPHDLSGVSEEEKPERG